MSQATSLIFRNCLNIDENMGACAGHLILEVIEIALIIIAATNVLGLPPLGVGLFTGFSALALLITSVSCCCWRRQEVVIEGRTQALYTHALSTMLNYVNDNTEQLECRIDVKYLGRYSDLPHIDRHVLNDRSSAKLHLQKFMDEMKKSPLDMNQLECVSFTLTGKQQDEETYWLALFTLRWDLKTEKLVGENPRYMRNVKPDEDRTFAKQYTALGVIMTEIAVTKPPKIDAQGNFI